MKNLKQELAALTYNKACALLGEAGEQLLRQGGHTEIDLDAQLSFGQNIFWLNLPDASVTITATEKGLQHSCSSCLFNCEHSGAALSVILEEKEALGLLEVSPFVDENTGGELIQQALTLREERAQKEDMELSGPNEGDGPWGDYRILSHNSGKTYRVALRGLTRGLSFCSCPDFKCNTLGTCKHLIFAKKVISEKYSDDALNSPFIRTHTTVHLIYGTDVQLKLELPKENIPEALKLFSSGPITDIAALMKAIQQSISAGYNVVIYPDAAEFIDNILFKQRIDNLVRQIRNNPETHSLRTELLKEPLLPYQLDGIAFAAQAGRSVIADDMGLGKTIQAIGLSQFLKQQAGIKRVLVISPASLKFQWQKEITKFTDLSSIIIAGDAETRSAQYDTNSFFTICNYEQVLKDKPFIERLSWDLIILDEGQRIKNYESKTSQAIKSLRSTYALVLSGTPLENRLEDLFSIINFVDSRLLGPAFQFFEDYQIKDDKGRISGYKNLDLLRAKLSTVLIRRTRKGVLPELPEMSQEMRFIPPSEAQLALDTACRKQMQMIISKKHLSEMDLLRLRKAMTESRMAANSITLVDRQSDEKSGKIKEIREIIEQLSAHPNYKVLIFSEWNLMLDKIADELDEMDIIHNRIDGTLKANQKDHAVNSFNNSETAVLLCSNTASLGLNLQTADTLINVDIPWSPARMEQRKARAHRLGQSQPVHVISLVTAGTIEERLLHNFDKKMELFTAALDPETDICEVSMTGGMSDLRTKLQTLLTSSKSSGHHLETVVSMSKIDKESIAHSAGQLLAESLNFLADIVPLPATAHMPENLPAEMRKNLLSRFGRNEQGELELTVKIADEEVIDRLAAALARLSSWQK
jgi:superfamily II DNA or RNA helicase